MRGMQDLNSSMAVEARKPNAVIDILQTELLASTSQTSPGQCGCSICTVRAKPDYGGVGLSKGNEPTLGRYKYSRACSFENRDD